MDFERRPLHASLREQAATSPRNLCSTGLTRYERTPPTREDATPPDALLVIDLETTGGSPTAGAQVLEWGAALVVGGRVKQAVGTLIRPARRRDLHTPQARAARRVHGIGDDEVWTRGMRLAAAADRCRTWIGRVRDRYGRVALTAYNIGFERRFLDAEPWCLTALDDVEWGPCVLAIARKRLPHMKTHRLTAVADHLDLPTGRAHRATDDAVLAARVWLALESSGGGTSV